jgi:hypothetical protein
MWFHDETRVETCDRTDEAVLAASHVYARVQWSLTIEELIRYHRTMQRGVPAQRHHGAERRRCNCRCLDQFLTLNQEVASRSGPLNISWQINGPTPEAVSCPRLQNRRLFDELYSELTTCLQAYCGEAACHRRALPRVLPLLGMPTRNERTSS